MRRRVPPTTVAATDEGPVAPPKRQDAGVRTSPVLFERDHELDVLADARRDAGAGDGRLVVVEGAAGIGKTELLAIARRLAADEGFTVVTSRASELERQYAFGVVRQLFETGVATDPSWSDGAGAAARPAFEPGTGDVPAFDDVQWCDRPSSQFIAFLGRRLEGLRVLVLLGLRTPRGRQDAVMGEVLRQPTTLLVQPAPLTELAVGRFLEDRLGAAPQRAFSTACRDATGGNPLLLDELARAMRTDHVQPESAGVSVIADLGPRAVSRTVLLRLARLDDGAVALARAVSVVGERGDLALLSAMTGLFNVRWRWPHGI